MRWALAGSRVTVRVVERSDPEMLLAVFQGNLGVLSHASIPRSSGLSTPPADEAARCPGR